MENDKDPLGLSKLPMVKPDVDGWQSIKATLEADAIVHGRTAPFKRPAWRVPAALAASVVLLLTLLILGTSGVEPVYNPASGIASVSPDSLRQSAAADGNLENMIAFSQGLELRLRELRSRTGAMPAQEVVFVAELEDLVARVDNELSTNSDSLDLWGQRVNLMLDLEYIYQHQFEREYGRMASL